MIVVDVVVGCCTGTTPHHTFCICHMPYAIMSVPSSTPGASLVIMNQPPPLETTIPWKPPAEPANPVVKGLPLHYGSILYVLSFFPYSLLYARGARLAAWDGIPLVGWRLAVSSSSERAVV